MIADLDRGLEALRVYVGRGLRIDGSGIDRVEARKDQSLVFTLKPNLDAGFGQRWFVYAGGKVQEVVPGDDPRIILCKKGRLDPDWQVLAWRPKRRICVKANVDGKPIVIKGYRKGRIEKAMARHSIAARQLAGSTALRALAPQAWGTRAEALAFPWREGSTVRITSGATDLFRLVGEGLQSLQVAPTDGDWDRHGAEDELLVLDTLLRRVEPWAAVPQEWHATRREVCSEQMARSDGDLVVCHRDLHDGQLLDCGERIVLLDFDLLGLADPALDVANLTAHFQLRLLQGSKDVTASGVEACSRAVIEGLGKSEQAGFRKALRFYQTTTFLRLALLYTLRPRWRHLADPLCAYAQRCAGEIDG